jgi:hypothetical protein
MRADQALDWVASFAVEAAQELEGRASGLDLHAAWPALMWRALRETLRGWLVPVAAADPLRTRPFIYLRRVEAIYAKPVTVTCSWTEVRSGARPRRLRDPRDLRRGTIDLEIVRLSRWPLAFPDEFRASVPGLDPVHTPENARAGLTRYLIDGWDIDDDGRLACGPAPGDWGPSISRIPHAWHDAPRRLMLGASLQARAVPLESAEPRSTSGTSRDGFPPGRRLRAAFSTLFGWTHEDAIVISRSAAEKLASKPQPAVTVHVPVGCSDVIVRAVGDQVRRGDHLVRGRIDLYALGARRDEALKWCGAEDGWVTVAIPGASAPHDGTVMDLKRAPLDGSRYRERIRFALRGASPATVGDKLATWHGVKGVVSDVRDDDQMPLYNGRHAEIVLSPVGVARRGAIGQLLEAAGSEASEAGALRHGEVFVLRQPQDAFPACRACGGKDDIAGRGQRYGEMELWALMAHGAEKVASELLSASRASPRWMREEQQTGAVTAQAAATSALNRYLAVAGLRVDRGRLVRSEHVEATNLRLGSAGDLLDALHHIEDAEWFHRQPGVLARVYLLDRLDRTKPLAVRLDARGYAARVQPPDGEEPGSLEIELKNLFIPPP